jgi:hypothetical protein
MWMPLRVWWTWCNVRKILFIPNLYVQKPVSQALALSLLTCTHRTVSKQQMNEIMKVKKIRRRNFFGWYFKPATQMYILGSWLSRHLYANIFILRLWFGYVCVGRDISTHLPSWNWSRDLHRVENNLSLVCQIFNCSSAQSITTGNLLPISNHPN